MKKGLFLFLFIILASSVDAQQKPIDGFLGIKFNSTREQVINVAKLKGGISDPATTSKNQLGYKELSIAGRKAFRVTFQFHQNRFYQSFVFYVPDEDPQLYILYNEILKDLNEVYGVSEPQREFVSPFKFGDGDEYVAIATGHAKISDTWIDTNTNCGIQLYITGKPYMIGLIYQNTKMYDEAKGNSKINDY